MTTPSNDARTDVNTDKHCSHHGNRQQNASGNESAISQPVFVPKHGGDLVGASAHYGIPIDEWVDLSTGINPESYPVDIPLRCYQQLPYCRPEFLAASAQYYCSSHFIPVTGTQAAIQQLPAVLHALPILIPQLGYQEHRDYWQASGAVITEYPSDDRAAMVAFIDCAIRQNARQHVLVINPNNPTGLLMGRTQLLQWAQQLGTEAYLMVDEAFIDTSPEESVLDEQLPDNVIVLRSFGKFFGLAGIRLGYCFAASAVLNRLRQRLGLWQMNGPAQAIASQALNDTSWQQGMIPHLVDRMQQLQTWLEPLMLSVGGQRVLEGHPLFSSYTMTSQQAYSTSDFFAQAGILLRVIEIGCESQEEQNEEPQKEYALLRIGLCAPEHDSRLQATIEHAMTYFSKVNHV